MELRDVGCKFLYAAEDSIALIDERTLEEHTVPINLIKNETKSLLEGKFLVATSSLNLSRRYAGQVKDGTGPASWTFASSSRQVYC